MECIGEWLENAGGVGNKTAIEVNEAEEALEVLNSLWLRIGEDGVYIGGEGSDAGGSDLVAKKGDRGLGKSALGKVDQKAIGPEDV